MRDFTLYKYTGLLRQLQQAGYIMLSFEDYLTMSDVPERFVILRHDIDKRANQALLMATVEKELGAHTTYYFRIVPESNKLDIIRKLAAMGFEIGYHYEDVTICNGNIKEAARHFEDSLAYFRQYYPVKTVCMHGSPRSEYDNRDLWKHYDYHVYGIIGEPYFDIDFSNVFYLTDTGRRWDGYNVSVRDKIPQYQDQWIADGLVYHTTDDIITAAKEGRLPMHIMMTTHPQRWLDNMVLWCYELMRQSLVNMVKRFMTK